MVDAHVIPIGGDHEASSTCWCQPVYEDTPEGGRIFVHRRFLDGPVYEDDWCNDDTHTHAPGECPNRIDH